MHFVIFEFRTRTVRFIAAANFYRIEISTGTQFVPSSQRSALFFPSVILLLTPASRPKLPRAILQPQIMWSSLLGSKFWG